MSISKVGEYAFYQHPNLERVVVPAPVIEMYAFQNAKKLEVADLTSEAAVNIAPNAFDGCSKLTHLVVRSTARSTLSATSALDGTKIKNGDGGIYVPSSLLDSYKSGTNWSTYAKNIYPLDEYPRANFDSIQDSWEAILSNASYATDYSAKDSKTMVLTDGTKIRMDIAAFDTDDKSDDSGKAKMTWICHDVPFTHVMKSTTEDANWAESEMRSFLANDILSKIPQEIKSHIVSVKKTYVITSGNAQSSTGTSDDSIWLLSSKEVGMPYNSEESGQVYSNLFTVGNSNAAYRTRVKLNASGSPEEWFLRTGSTAYKYYAINVTGASNANAPSSTSKGVVFGFCTD